MWYIELVYYCTKTPQSKATFLKIPNFFEFIFIFFSDVQNSCLWNEFFDVSFKEIALFFT